MLEPHSLIDDSAGCVQLALGDELGGTRGTLPPPPPTPPKERSQEPAHAELGGVSGRRQESQAAVGNGRGKENGEGRPAQKYRASFPNGTCIVFLNNCIFAYLHTVNLQQPHLHTHLDPKIFGHIPHMLVRLTYL